MKKTILLFCFTFCFLQGLLAQMEYFNKRYDFNNQADLLTYGICTLSDGYFIAYETEDINSQNDKQSLVIMKINFTGDLLWRKTYGSNKKYFGTLSNLIKTSDSAILVPCWIQDTIAHNSKFILLKCTYDGDTIWSKTYPATMQNTLVYSAMETRDNSYLFGGLTQPFDGTTLNPADFYAIKIDQMGKLIWYKSFEGGGNDVCLDLAEDESGNFLLAGYSRDNGTGLASGYIIKINDQGNKIWEQKISSPNSAAFVSIKQTVDKNFVVAGQYFSTSLESSGQGWILKIDSDGNKIWDNFYGSDKFEGLWRIIETPDENLIAVGGTKNTTTKRVNVLILCTNSIGDSLWSKIFQYDSLQGNFENFFYDIQKTKDGGLLLSGNCLGANNTQDAWLLKTDCHGNDKVNYFPNPKLSCAPLVTEAPAEIPHFLNVSVYPNPFRYETNFVFKEIKSKSMLTLEIFNLEGQKLDEEKIIPGTFQYKLQKQDLSQGFYLYTIRDENKIIHKGKLVVE